MIHSVKIKGYRAFSDFSMDGLGRLNLLVGKNNAGKSSILEALALLWSGGNLLSLWQILSKRGEAPILDTTPGRPFQPEVDVFHVFAGHQPKAGSQFTITTTNDQPGRSLTYGLVEAKPEENPTLFNLITAQEPTGAGISLKVSGRDFSSAPIPLTQRGSLRNDVFNQAFALSRSSQTPSEPVQFVTTESLPCLGSGAQQL